MRDFSVRYLILVLLSLLALIGLLILSTESEPSCPEGAPKGPLRSSKVYDDYLIDSAENLVPRDKVDLSAQPETLESMLSQYRELIAQSPQDELLLPAQFVEDALRGLIRKLTRLKRPADVFEGVDVILGEYSELAICVLVRSEVITGLLQGIKENPEFLQSAMEELSNGSGVLVQEALVEAVLQGQYEYYHYKTDSVSHCETAGAIETLALKTEDAKVFRLSLIALAY